MKPYGYNISRDGSKAHKHACCDIRNGCYHRDEASKANRKSVDRAFKRRARAAGRADAKAGASDA